MLLVEIFRQSETLLGTEITTNGWVRTCRKQKHQLFIQMSDGTTQQNLQIIVLPENINNFDEVLKLTTGSSIGVSGTLVKSPASGQTFELKALNVQIYQQCSSEFPMQKVGLPLKFLREHAHLRHRTNLMGAIFRVKSKIINAIHDFFTKKNYCLIDIPMLTTNACEGGCQPLLVTSLMSDSSINNIPKINQTSNGQIDQIDFSKDFFGNPVYLTVSNQLHLECFAHGMGPVYTITQATRGEPSQSTKHLANFEMLEYEFCFGQLSDNIDVAEQCIKFCIKKALECCDEMTILDKASGHTLLPKLTTLTENSFERITHYDAIGLLKEAHQLEPFQESPQYDTDLTGEHERYLVKHFGKPVVVMYYPKAVKAFYMPVCHTIEVDGQTIEYVDCYDLLMDIGEVVGGSQRIWSESELLDRMTELHISAEHLSWYVDLRKYGSVPHGGAGIGIERLVAVITGMTNVKDCTTFPITIHHCTY